MAWLAQELSGLVCFVDAPATPGRGCCLCYNLSMSSFEEKVLSALEILQKDVNRVEVILESHEEKFDQIIEIVSPEMEKSNDQSLRLDDHENRILKLEAA